VDIEIIFITQVASILGFLVTLFVLYRLLVKQKDSTIELLKEKNGFLELLLSEAKKQTPDLLVENISNRVKLLNEELERLNQDKETNELLITEKEKELSSSKGELEKLRTQFERAEELMSEFFCPHCKAPMISRAYGWESVEYNGRDESPRVHRRRFCLSPHAAF
jgi:hypothetical protein